MEQGHHPLTDFWANRDLDWSNFWGVLVTLSSMSRLHFSGILAGEMRLRRFSSTVPAKQSTLAPSTTWARECQMLHTDRHTVSKHFTKVIIQGEFIIVPYLNDQLRWNSEFCFVKTPKMFLFRENIQIKHQISSHLSSYTNIWMHFDLLVSWNGMESTVSILQLNSYIPFVQKVRKQLHRNIKNLAINSKLINSSLMSKPVLMARKKTWKEPDSKGNPESVTDFSVKRIMAIAIQSHHGLSVSLGCPQGHLQHERAVCSSIILRDLYFTRVIWKNPYFLHVQETNFTLYINLYIHTYAIFNWMLK